MTMTCPSTGMIYLEWVGPEVGSLEDADEAQAEALGVSIEDYLTMQEA